MQIIQSSATKDFNVSGRVVKVRYTVSEYIGFSCETPTIVDLTSTEVLSEEEKNAIVDAILHDRNKDSEEYLETQEDKEEYWAELMCEEERGN